MLSVGVPNRAGAGQLWPEAGSLQMSTLFSGAGQWPSMLRGRCPIPCATHLGM